MPAPFCTKGRFQTYHRISVQPQRRVWRVAKRSPQMCNCITEFDEKLKDVNGRISVTFAISQSLGDMGVRPRIAVEKINTRGKTPPLAIPSFCPFCGEKYALGDKPAEAAA